MYIRPSAGTPYGTSHPNSGCRPEIAGYIVKQLVHQLTGALHQHGLARPRRGFVLVRAANHQPVARRPSDPMRRHPRVAQHDVWVTELPAHGGGHRLGHREIGFAPLEMAAQRLELGGGAAGGDHDVSRADRALRGDDVGVLPGEPHFLHRRLLTAARRRRARRQPPVQGRPCTDRAWRLPGASCPSPRPVSFLR